MKPEIDCSSHPVALSLTLSDAEYQMLKRIFEATGGACIGIHGHQWGADKVCVFHSDPHVMTARFPTKLRELEGETEVPLPWRLGTAYSGKVRLDRPAERVRPPTLGDFWSAKSVWYGDLLDSEQRRPGWQPRQMIFLPEGNFHSEQIISIHTGVLTRLVTDEIVSFGLAVTKVYPEKF